MRSRRRVWWAAAVGLAAVTVALVVGGTRGAEIANVLALPVGIAALAAGVLGSRPRTAEEEEALRAAAQELAKRIKEREDRNLAELLRPLAYYGDRPT